MNKNGVSITLKDEVLRTALKHIAAAGTDMTPLMRAIAGTLATETALNFEDEGRPPWVPSLAAQARDGQTLSDSGHLKRGITTAYDAHSAAVGTNVEYGRIHQLGGTVERKGREVYFKLSKDGRPGRRFVKKSVSDFAQAARDHTATYPARPFLPVKADGSLQDGVEQKLLDTALRYLESASRQQAAR
ncbi:phage virion morphogenesis protein [Salmonella enterica]|nr:phage virion morphogenesis protein [Salmonella enterica]ELB8084878.1 phage virion morphogenesis protein [Salmonella enterica]ELJ1892591.1 phage virion morphogenesis protein [Salmonella enterica]